MGFIITAGWNDGNNPVIVPYQTDPALTSAQEQIVQNAVEHVE